MTGRLDYLPREEIFKLRPEEVKRSLDKTELEAIFLACNAFWHHPGEKNIQAPHVELTSGKHSNIYVNCPQVLERSNLCQIMAYQILQLLFKHYPCNIDWVVGSDSAALGLAKDVANLTNAKWRPLQKNPDKTQTWEKGTILPDENVLHIEELLTTGGTTKAVRDGIHAGNFYPVNFIPFIPVLVHRPDPDAPDVIEESKIIHLLHYDTYVVDPSKEECQLCQKGSPALPAKENWTELVNSMLGGS